MVLEGVSGAVHRLAGHQPLLGLFLDLFDRAVVGRVGLLAGHEVFANSILAVLGVVVIVAAERARPS
jgi:hypothetical protein